MEEMHEDAREHLWEEKKKKPYVYSTWDEREYAMKQWLLYQTEIQLKPFCSILVRK